jgi:YesN/AraC family two-component response regulator
MAHNQYNSIPLEKNGELLPHGINNFIISDSKGMPLIAPELHPLLPGSPFFFDGMVLGICVQGEATVAVNYKRYSLKANSTLTILPSHVFQIESQSEDFILECVFFSYNVFVGLVLPSDFNVLFQIAKQPCMPVSKQVAQTILNYHDFITEQYNSTQEVYRVQIIRGLLYALLLYVVSIYKKTENVKYTGTMSRQEGITASFLMLLNEHYISDRKVSFYADKLCITSKYLSQVVKETTFRPVLKWITDRIITEAKLRLRATNMSVLQISEELNFPNPSFFGQFFKKHTGTTPFKFRHGA